MTTGFNVPLITFSPNTNILASDVNTNFYGINTASIFTGTIAKLKSDGGALTSDGSGNLLCEGGKLGVLAFGDRIDVATTPGTLYLSAPTGFSFSLGGLVGGSITTAGLALGSNVPFNFTTGSLQLTTTFNGVGTGTYNHGLSDIPDYAQPVQNVDVVFGYTRVGVDAWTTSTIHVSTGTANPFICYLIVTI